MTSFASGKYSNFVCDCCGFAYPYKDRLKTSYGTIVCATCHDGAFDLKNHPQNKPPPVSPDPQALQEPRPEVVLDPPEVVWDPSMTIRLDRG